MLQGVGMLVALEVPLQGAAVRVAGVLVPLRCRCKVLLQGAAAPVCGLRSAVAGCGCRVLRSKGCLHLGNSGASTGCCCQSAVCAMQLGGWCRSSGWLRDVYGSVGVGPWSRWCLCRRKKGKRFVVTKNYLLLSGIYTAVMIWNRFLSRLFSVEAFCLDISFVLGWLFILMSCSWQFFSHGVSFSWKLRNLPAKCILCTARLAQSTSQHC